MADKNENQAERWERAAKNFQMKNHLGDGRELDQHEEATHQLIEDIAFALREFHNSPGGIAARKMLEFSRTVIEIAEVDEGNKFIFGFFGFGIVPNFGDDPPPEEDGIEPLIAPVRFDEAADILIEKGMAGSFASILESSLDDIMGMAPKND